MLRQIVGLVLLAGVAAASVQQPFAKPSSREAETDDYFQFDWPIQRVAIIGAGSRYLVCPPCVALRLTSTSL